MRLGAMFRFLLLLLISAAFAIPTTSRGASTSANLAITVTKAQAITGVSLSSSSFTGGAPSGTVVGTISVSMTPASPAFSGTLTLSGSNASSFQIAGTNLETNGVLPAGTYQINIVATQAGATGSPFTAAETITGTSTSSQGGGDPTVGLLPSNRSVYASWSMAGLKSIGGIPNRTTIFKTLSPSGGDDTPAIQAALNACPSDQVVQLTAGVFRINGNGLYFRTSNCTLRGAGPGNPALNTGLNTVQAGDSFTASCTPQSSPNSIYCPDPSATQLIKADRATNASYGVLYVQPSSVGFGTSTNLAADAVQGTNTLTLASWPNPGINVGDFVLIDINTDNYPDVVWGPVFGPPGDGTRRWFSRQDRSISQIMEVTAVNSSNKTVTFSTPFHITMPVAYQAQLTQSSGPFLKKVGVENLFIWGGRGGDGGASVSLWDCAYCWVKNVDATWSEGSSIAFSQTFRSELRDSYIHESAWPNPGGGGYLTALNTGASDNLFENNIMWNGNKEDVMRGTGGGNVLGYNYTDDSFDNGTSVISSEAGVNAGHYTTPHMELLEGNYSQNYKGDTYWGNSIYITAFRNQFSGLRAAHPPLNNYVVVQGNCHYKYGDWNGRQAVDVQAYDNYQSFIGNVLGFNGQTLLANPYHSESCFNDVQKGFVEQILTAADNSTPDNNDSVAMWRFGLYQAGGWTYVANQIQTQLRQGNWDWVTKKQHWYGIGGTTDGAGAPATIPNSFYLSSKPAFFGTQTWPWVDPTTGTTYTLPAKYCFEHNMMPTCLQ
jgi:hypothetical protein